MLIYYYDVLDMCNVHVHVVKNVLFFSLKFDTYIFIYLGKR